MTNVQAAAQANAAGTESAPKVDNAQIHDPVFVQSKWGAVAVYGHEHVSKKHLLIIQHCLALDAFNDDDSDHQVRMINLRPDGMPMRGNKSILGIADIDSGAITLNLMHLFSRAVEGAINEPVFSITACLQQEFIVTLLHEIDHLANLYPLSNERRKAVQGDEAVVKNIEEQADEWACAMIIDLAKTVDIEPPHIAEAPFWAQQMMEALATEDDDPWYKSQRWMLENGIFMHKPATEDEAAYTLHSFKHCCCHLADGRPDSPEWAIATASTETVSLAQPETVEAAVETEVGGQDVVADMVVPVTPTYVAETPQQPQPQPVPAPNLQPQFVSVRPEDVWQAHQESMSMPEDLPDDGDTSYAEYADGPTVSESEADVNIAPAPQPVMYPQAPQTVYTPQVPQAAPQQVAPQTVYTPQVPQYASLQQGSPAEVPMGDPMPVGEVKPYPNNGLSVDETKRIMVGVYTKIYNHLFTVCGRGHTFPEHNDSMHDGTPEFNIHNVHMMGIELTEDEMKVVVKMDCLDSEGKWCGGITTAAGCLLGYITKKTKLPQYKLYLNVEGNEVVRLIMPQNPAKLKPNGEYSGPAKEAQKGNAIMYVMEGDDAIADAVDPNTGAQIGKKFLMKCINGAFEGC